MENQDSDLFEEAMEVCDQNVKKMIKMNIYSNHYVFLSPFLGSEQVH